MHIDILLNRLAKPAQRAIQGLGITTIEQLSEYCERDVLELHGIGNNAMNIIKQVLSENGLAFSNKK